MDSKHSEICIGDDGHDNTVRSCGGITPQCHRPGKWLRVRVEPLRTFGFWGHSLLRGYRYIGQLQAGSGTLRVECMDTPEVSRAPQLSLLREILPQPTKGERLALTKPAQEIKGKSQRLKHRGDNKYKVPPAGYTAQPGHVLGPAVSAYKELHVAARYRPI